MEKEKKHIRGNRDLTDMQIGYLTVISQAPTKPSKYGPRYYWNCRCKCGAEIVVREDALMNPTKPTQSCGCLRKESLREHYQTHQAPIKHGHSYERLFNIWYLIKYRCENPKSPAYRNYGARGLKMCNEWSDKGTGYETFKEWAISHGYAEDLTIDRIDNNDGYNPGNCRWIDKGAQARNTRRSVLLTFDGRTQPAPAWAEEIGIQYKTLMRRLHSGWSVEQAITQPVRKRSNKKSA